MSTLRSARCRAGLAAAMVLLIAACQETTLPTNLVNEPAGGLPAVSASRILRCEVEVSARQVECAPPLDFAATLPNGISADRIVGGQGVYVRLTSSGVSYNGGTGSFTFNTTVQNLMTTAMGTTDGVASDPAGVQVFLFSGPTLTEGTGAIAVVPTGFSFFTSAAQAYYQYSGADLGGDGILVPGEVSAAKGWQFILPPTVIKFTFNVYVSTETADVGPAVSIAPQVTSVSPNPMIPGASATLTGYNFNATMASNTVTIGGRAATVTGVVGTTQLTVTVPCVGSGNQAIQVTNLDGANPDLAGAPLAHPLQVTQRTVGLGQAVILTNANEIGCNELTATGVNTRYIVAVYNTNTTPSNNAPVQISGDVDEGGAPITLPSRVTSPGDLTALPPALRRAAEQARIADEKHLEIMDFSAREYQRLRTHFANQPAPQQVDRQMADPPVTRQFRIVNFAGNSCNSFYVIQATRKYWNGKLAIYEDDATPDAFKASLNATMQTYITSIGDQFNADMEPVVRNNFGDILLRDAVTDNDGALIALFTPHINNNLAGVAGFVISCDQFANDDVTPRLVGGPYTGSTVNGNGGSNHGQFFYAYQPVTPGTGYAGETADQWYRTIRSTFIHESKHVASQSARVANGAPSYEVSWLEEGTARHSEELWMRLEVDNKAWKSNIVYGSAGNPINIYCDLRPTSGVCNVNPVRPASIMFRHFSSLYNQMSGTAGATLSPFGPTPSDGASNFYAISWSLVRYAIDRYGASDAAFLTALNSSTTSGATNLAARAGVSIEQLLGGWALALAADDYPGLAASTDIQMPTWNFRDIYAGLNTDFPGFFAPAYPLVPTTAAFGAFTPVNAATLNGGGVLWYTMSGTQTAPQLIRMLGNGGVALPSSVRIAITRVE